MEVFTSQARYKLAQLLNWGVGEDGRFLSNERMTLSDAAVWFIVCQMIGKNPELADNVSLCFEESANSVFVTQAANNLR